MLSDIANFIWRAFYKLRDNTPYGTDRVNDDGGFGSAL